MAGEPNGGGEVSGGTGQGEARGPVGVVLAGGRSRRMGRDKATLELADVALAERAARRLAAVVDEVVAADGGRGVVAGRESVADGPGAGPAAGLLGAAAARAGRDLLVLACDLPAVPGELLAELARSGPWDLALPVGPEGVEPLCALWRPPALARLGERVAAGRLALHPLAEEAGLRVRRVAGEELAAFGDPARIFVNLNRPEDLEAWRREG